MNAIAPLTVVRMTRSNAGFGPELQLGDLFRIGYYSERDGLECVYLVNAEGEYEQTWDQATLLDFFEVVTPSGETDFYGVDRRVMRPLP